MASVHPCRHASVMKVLLDRAEGALRRRREKQKSGLLKAGETGAGLEGLVDSTKKLSVKDSKLRIDKGEDEWDLVSDEEEKEDDVAIRVDQYLVVFLKVRTSAFSLHTSLHVAKHDKLTVSTVHLECHSNH